MRSSVIDDKADSISLHKLPSSGFDFTISNPLLWSVVIYFKIAPKSFKSYAECITKVTYKIVI